MPICLGEKETNVQGAGWKKTRIKNIQVTYMKLRDYSKWYFTSYIYTHWTYTDSHISSCVQNGFGTSDAVQSHICREFIWKSSTWLHNIHFYISEKWHSTNTATTTATATAAAAIEAAMFSWMVDKQTNKLCIFNSDVVWKMAFKLTREMYFMPLKMSEHVSSPLPPLFLFYVAIWFLFKYVPIRNFRSIALQCTWYVDMVCIYITASPKTRKKFRWIFYCHVVTFFSAVCRAGEQAGWQTISHSIALKIC